MENNKPLLCWFACCSPRRMWYLLGAYWCVLAMSKSFMAGSVVKRFPEVVSIKACKRGSSFTMASPANTAWTSSAKVAMDESM